MLWIMTKEALLGHVTQVRVLEVGLQSMVLNPDSANLHRRCAPLPKQSIGRNHGNLVSGPRHHCLSRLDPGGQ